MSSGESIAKTEDRDALEQRAIRAWVRTECSAISDMVEYVVTTDVAATRKLEMRTQGDVP